MKLNDNDTLALYTDGLVERRAKHLDHGFTRLREVATTHAHRPVAELPRRLSRSLVDQPDDDLALLAVRKVAPQAHPVTK